MLELKNISLQRGNKQLLDSVNLKIMPSDKIGFIGKNGTGKSSLFALIMQKISQDKGDIIVNDHINIACTQQEIESVNISAIDFVLLGDTKLYHLNIDLEKAYAQNNTTKISTILDELEHINAYNAHARAAKLLSGLGFTQQDQYKLVSEFSGGWKVRLALAQTLMTPADLLLLDEPTNHLDIEAVMWLESYLKSLKTAQIIVSHDSEFLNNTCNAILELEQQKLVYYKGDYDNFVNEKHNKLNLQANIFKKQQKQIEHLQNFISRFSAKASKATQAQSKMKALNKIQQVAPIALDSQFSIEFFNNDNSTFNLINLKQLNCGYTETPVISGVNLDIVRGARIGILGVNGSGKSTFIKTITGELQELAGEIIKAEKLKIGYFAQHQIDNLNIEHSALWHIEKSSSTQQRAKTQEILNFLGRFNFKGTQTTDCIKNFSGGEKARLALACIVWQRPDILLLDEPTNHLDLQMRKALSIALTSFNGAILLVTHDRSLLESVADEYILIENGKLSKFAGNLQDYHALRMIQNQSTNTNAHKQEKKLKTTKSQKKLEMQTSSNKTQTKSYLKKELAKIENELSIQIKQQQEIETFISSSDAYLDDNKLKLTQSIQELTKIQKNISSYESRWIEIIDELEAVDFNTDANISHI